MYCVCDNVRVHGHYVEKVDYLVAVLGLCLCLRAPVEAAKRCVQLRTSWKPQPVKLPTNHQCLTPVSSKIQHQRNLFSCHVSRGQVRLRHISAVVQDEKTAHQLCCLLWSAQVSDYRRSELSVQMAMLYIRCELFWALSSGCKVELSSALSLAVMKTFCSAPAGWSAYSRFTDALWREWKDGVRWKMGQET